jgi:hypothetical protein
MATYTEELPGLFCPLNGKKKSPLNMKVLLQKKVSWLISFDVPDHGVKPGGCLFRQVSIAQPPPESSDFSLFHLLPTAALF